MNTRTKFVYWCVLAILLAGPTLISCANSNVEEADADAEAYEETVTDAETSDSDAEVADNEETGFDENTEDESEKKEETVASNEESGEKPTEAVEGQKKDSDFEPLADDDFENLSFDEQGATNTASSETSTTPSTPATDGLGDLGTTTAASDTTTSDLGLGSTPTLADPVEQPKPKVFRASVMPKIPQEAVSKQGTSLNRYYFLRKGDTPNSVANLIYGQESRAEDLTNWNSTAWVPGNLIYYVSPQEAGDTQMKSLYEERNLQPSFVAVKRGESISQIALKRLGHVNSWKELAVVNQLDRPDNLSKGQKLKYFEDLGETPVMAEAPITPPAPPVVAPPPPVTPPPPPPADLAAKPPVENKPKLPERKERGSDLNIAKLLKQNLFFITMGLGVGLLLLALVAINRKKREAGAAGEEFNEDAFAPPRKKRR